MHDTARCDVQFHAGTSGYASSQGSITVDGKVLDPQDLMLYIKFDAA